MWRKTESSSDRKERVIGQNTELLDEVAAF